MPRVSELNLLVYRFLRGILANGDGFFLISGYSNFQIANAEW